MIVVDTSALVDLLVESPINVALVARLRTVAELHVPHLVDVEVLSVIRKLESRGAITGEQGELVLRKLDALPLHRYPHHALASRVWELRHALTADDGQFVALAETLGLPLVTCDRKLASAPGHRAIVESYTR